MCVAYNSSDKVSADESADKKKAPYVVLKFGSSVLRKLDDLQIVVSEIYRNVRFGTKVVAVVSAFEGETDSLINEASRLGAGAGSRHAPRLIALGEERSAALLALACEGAGLDARIAGARSLSLRAGGDVEDAHPIDVDRDTLIGELRRHDVVIVPGFVAIGETGEPVLLGRGGTDLTAAFLAERLGAGEVTLVKDVPGVFDRDPATSDGAELFFEKLSWAEAKRVAGKLVQPKSINYAADRNVEIRVRRAGAVKGTQIGGVSVSPINHQEPRPLRVSLAGLGVVGAGAVRRLLSEKIDYRLATGLVRNLTKSRPDYLNDITVTDDQRVLFESAPDVIIDALSCGDAGKALTLAALKNGVSVVTANKQAIAGSLKDLHALAEENGAAILYSASVGGGAPMVETAARARVAGTVQSIAAVLNGTVNFILCEVANGANFDEAVLAAQKAGFAEADPSADLSGDDARAKLSILSYVAFGEEISLDEISCEALTAKKASEFAASGKRWKQISTIKRDQSGKIVGRVRFKPVGDDPYFRTLDGEGNGMVAVNADGRIFSCRGKGAGRIPTVESLLADLNAIRTGA